ncbi:MAG TPA: hypothetical protein PLI95_23055 [Polyangiaceae bacterium]|nr:hypothetical protein [Polyangiaceae bacterium]
MRYAILFAVAAAALSACSPISAPKPAEEANPLEGSKPADVSHVGQPPPVQNQEGPDMDFLIDMAGRSGRQALKCDAPEVKGPRDTATVDVTFEPTGWSGAVVVHKPHEGTPIGECIQRAFEKVPVTNFKGSAVTLTQTIDYAKKTIGKASGGGASPAAATPEAPPSPGTTEKKQPAGGGYF